MKVKALILIGLALAACFAGCGQMENEYQRLLREAKTSTYTLTILGPSGPVVYQGARLVPPNYDSRYWRLADGATLVIDKDTYSFRKE